MKKWYFLFYILINITAFAKQEVVTINIDNPNEVYKLDNLYLYFKPEDNLNFKEKNIDMSSWYLINTIEEWSSHPKVGVYRGLGWYRLYIVIHNIQDYAIFLPRTNRGLQIYLNGEFVRETKPFSTSGFTPAVVAKPEILILSSRLWHKGNNVLAIRAGELDGFSSFKGSILIGPVEKISIRWVQHILWYGSLAFISLFLSIYYLLYYFQRNKEYYYLFYSGLAFSLGLWILGWEGLALYIFDYVWIYNSFTYIAAILSPLMYINFIHSYFNIKKNYMGRLLEFFYIFILISFIANYSIAGNIRFFNSYLYNIFQIGNILVILYIILIIIKALRLKKPYAVRILIGTLIFGTSIYISMLVFLNILETGIYIIEGLFTMTIFFASALASHFAQVHCNLEKAHKELEELNTNLEQKVKDRTMELYSAMEELEETNENLIITKNALWGEMQLAKKIQTVLLPKEPKIVGYEISAYMAPAEEVGGDYYDIINLDGIDWLIIGDVSGHGVTAGLIMMMVQTAVQVTLIRNPQLNPSELLTTINTLITKNINKLGEGKFMTITMLAVYKDGQFIFSGLHKDIMIYRAKSNDVEIIKTSGVWIGISDDILDLVDNNNFTMNVGDTLLLYTDGIIEAWTKKSIKDSRDPIRDMFGQQRLSTIFREQGNSSVDTIKNCLLKELEEYECTDDVTLLILKRLD